MPPGELALGEPLPETRFDKVGFTLRGVASVLGVLSLLADSVVDGLVARGMSGSCCGVTWGWSPWLYAATCAVGLGCSAVGFVGMLV